METNPNINDYTTIKTYDDACTALGVKPIDDKELKRVGVDSHIIALMKLETISMALRGLNFEPVPKAEWDGTFYWYPWWSYYTQDEIKQFNDKNKPAALFGGTADFGSFAGFGYLATIYRPSRTSALIGFRLCQETEEKAKYFGVQFAELWAEHLVYNFTIQERII